MEGGEAGRLERWRDLPFLGLQRYQLSCAPAGRFLPQETAGVGHTQPAGNSAHARPLRVGPRGQQQTAKGACPRSAGGVATRERGRKAGAARSARGPAHFRGPSGRGRIFGGVSRGRWLRMRSEPLRGPEAVVSAPPRNSPK